jgi:hypothetical protein
MRNENQRAILGVRASATLTRSAFIGIRGAVVLLACLSMLRPKIFLPLLPLLRCPGWSSLAIPTAPLVRKYCEVHTRVLPLAVLLLSSLPAELGQRVQSVEYVEKTATLAVPAHHLVGRTGTVDFDLWIAIAISRHPCEPC